MRYEFVTLDDHLQKQIDYGSSGTDVLHGHLKVLILEAERELEQAYEEENRTGEAMDSMERKYWEGQLDALTHVYGMTYALSFAIQERDNRD